MEFNRDDLLVFESSDDTEVIDRVRHIVDFRRFPSSKYAFIVSGNYYSITLNMAWEIIEILDSHSEKPFAKPADTLRLREIWTKTDKETYKRVWTSKPEVEPAETFTEVNPFLGE